MPTSLNTKEWTTRKLSHRNFSDSVASSRDDWISKNKGFHQADADFLNFLIPAESRVLELGCGTGWLLANLKTSHCTGVDFSEPMIKEASRKHPSLTFVLGDMEDAALVKKLKKNGPFDYIILSDTIGTLDDILLTLNNVRGICSPETRLIVSHYSHVWQPVLKTAEMLGMKQSSGPDYNWLSMQNIGMFLDLCGFETIKGEQRQLIPKSLFGLGDFVNRWIAPLPFLRALCVRNYTVARLAKARRKKTNSVSVIVPARNERGNIEPAVTRLPDFGVPVEIIFVEGHSSDNSWEEILRVKKAYPNKDIKAFQQPGKGKGDAVHFAFQKASNDILMILDGDLTVAPEDLPKFHRAIADGHCEFVNGTRLIYPMNEGAMRFLNYLANRTFARIFSFLLNQSFSDTLCGTKVMYTDDYHKILRDKAYFGDFDPFGDFDFIFGAAKQNLKILEIPVRYHAREYGETQISRFRHGFMLLKMVIYAFRKLKAI